MTVDEIAAALGVPTLEEVAAGLGLPVGSIRPASPEPVLVLDFRGNEGARRWDRMAKPPIGEGVMAPGLDPFTGLRVGKAKRRTKRVRRT